MTVTIFHVELNAYMIDIENDKIDYSEDVSINRLSGTRFLKVC